MIMAFYIVKNFTKFKTCSQNLKKLKLYGSLIEPTLIHFPYFPAFPTFVFQENRWCHDFTVPDLRIFYYNLFPMKTQYFGKAHDITHLIFLFFFYKFQYDIFNYLIIFV